MKKVKIPSHTATINSNAPSFALSDDSIILVDDDGLETIVGANALDLAPNGGRVFGGTPEDRHYQRLVQALVAKGLGAGEHIITAGLSAPAQFVNTFRKDKGSSELNPVSRGALAAALKEIKFREGRSDAQLKVCRVTLVEDKPTPVLYETEAVSKVMPVQARSYLLCQIGCGDWQSVAVVGGKVMHHTHQRVPGVSGAEAKLQDLLHLSRSETKRAWLRGERPSKSMASDFVSCEEEKRRAARAHIAESLPSILNSLEGYHDRISAVVISGGAVHDEVFMEQLKAELPSTLTPFTLSDLKILDFDQENMMDPVFACASGIKSLGVSVALDIGNSHLKGIFTYE